MKTNSLKNRFVSRMGAGIALVTALGGLTMSAVPMTYAATTSQSATNLAEFTNLVDIYNGINASLTTNNSLSAVSTFVTDVNKANAATWGQVLYGTSYVPLTGAAETSLQQQQQAGITFAKALFNVLVGQVTQQVSTQTATVQALETTVKQAFDSGSSSSQITGTDLYNFYENFRTSVLNQLLTNGNLNSGATSLSLNAVVDTALQDAAGQVPDLKGQLGDYGLSIADIPAIRANFTNTFTAANGYGVGAQQVYNDLLATTVSPQLSGSAVAGSTVSLTFKPQNLGTTIDSLPALPSNLFTVTAGSNVTVSQTTGGISLTFLSAGTATINVTLRGYTFPISFPVAAASSGGSVGGGGGAVSGPTSTTANVTGTSGQPLTTAVLGTNGTQIQVNLPSDDVAAGLKLNLQSLTSLPSTVQSLTNVLQAIVVSALGSGSSSSTGTAVHYFAKPITITFTLSTAPSAPIAVVFWNPLTQTWQPVSNYTVNQNTVTVSTNHFTTYAVVDAKEVQPVNRLEGRRALDTSIQAAKAAYPDGASSVVLAFEGNKLPSPDALSAAGLAGALHAPFLLNGQASLDPAVLSTIQALGAKTVYVLGGPHALGNHVVSALQQAGLKVVRDFEGQTLYDTSALIDQYMYQNKLTAASTVYIANGQTMVDAVSGSPVAYQQGAPLMLVKTGQTALSADQLAFLKSSGVKNAVIFGGGYVVSPTLESQLDQQLGATNVLRLGGNTLNGTAAVISEHYFPNATGAVISTNGNPSGSFVDALSASAFAANNNLPILFTNQNALPASTNTYLKGLTSLHNVWVMGGPQAVQTSIDQTLQTIVTSSK